MNVKSAFDELFGVPRPGAEIGERMDRLLEDRAELLSTLIELSQQIMVISRRQMQPWKYGQPILWGAIERAADVIARLGERK